MLVIGEKLKLNMTIPHTYRQQRRFDYPMTTENKLWTRSFIMLVFASLFTFLSFQMLLPVLPAYVQTIGGSKFEAGLVTFLFAIAAVISRPYIGFILRFKTRKPLILIASFALLIITISYSFAPLVWFLLFLRLLHGLAWGWGTTVNGTAAFDIIPKSRVGEGMGYYMLSITLAMIIAPSLGIYIYQHVHFYVLILCAAVLGGIAFLLFSLIKYQTPLRVLENQKQVHRFSLRDSLIDRNSIFPALITLCVSISNGAIVTFIVIFGEERGLDQIFLFYFFNACMATVVRPITGRWFDRRGPWSLVMVCSFLGFVSLWTLAYTNSNMMLIFSGILFGVGYGSLIPALQAWVLSVTTEERSGTANGMFYSSIDLGVGISALILGFISTYVETAQLFKITSIFFMISIVLVGYDYIRQRKKKPGQISNEKELLPNQKETAG